MEPAGPDARTGTPFRFEYSPGVLRYGAGCVEDLAAELDRLGYERALVVCGRTVGETPAVVDPVRTGLGESLAGVFAETTPEKRIATAIDASEALRETGADVVVSLGGGSSLDLSKAAASIAGDDRWPEEIAREFEERGTVTVADDPLPIVAIPTTLAGADLSQGAGLTATPANDYVDTPVSGGLASRRLMPVAVFSDPDLVATTPAAVLAGSAMNGFDKGVETLYAATATPVTDATAVRGLQLLAPGLRDLGATGPSRDTLEPVLEGLLLVQYGISRPDAGTLSLVHAFGHGITAHSDVQQGAAHAVLVPHALDYLFDAVDGRRDLLAQAFGVDTADLGAAETATAVVDEVTAVRDSLDLPTRLRDLSGPERDDFEAVARDVRDDVFMRNAPDGLDPTQDDLVRVLEAAW